MSKTDIQLFEADLVASLDANDIVLPSTVKPEAFRNAAIVAMQDNPDILKCEKDSIFRALRHIASKGLVPDGREAAIVAFKGQAQDMTMVFGMVKMARRSGEIRDIRAHVVYQNEFDNGRFEYVTGDVEKLTHHPILIGDKGERILAYAVAEMKDGTFVRAVMDREEIEQARLASPQQAKSGTGSGIWAKWPGEMWKKSAIRRLCKRLDLSSEDMRQIMTDDGQSGMRDVTPDEKQRPNLAQMIAADSPALTGEVLIDHDFDPDTVDPLDGNYTSGVLAFQNDQPETACPYEMNSFEANNWLGGWRGAREAAA